ncbi:MAG: ribonuclease III [Desulfovibrio sp.]|nr:ribonuclease III [Desulfovibrio sp.]
MEYSTIPLHQVEAILGYVFQQQLLLATALTHSSWANEQGQAGLHNERQEFLGDAVLELCVSWELYRRFPRIREGELTKLRSALVSTGSLARKARQLGLDAALRLGRGEEQQGGRSRDAVLSDALEAVLAAVFEDGGFKAAQHVVGRIFAGDWPQAVGKPLQKDHKTRLQELTLQRYRSRPVYDMLSCTGPEHARVFEVSLSLPDGSVFQAVGSSHKKAEQEAARLALLHLDGIE